MKMSLSPSRCDESGHVPRVDPPNNDAAFKKKRKKARRGTRGKGRVRKWKPWSELTWEERRDLDLRGAQKQEQEQHDVVVVAKRSGKRGKPRTVAVPVAPHLTKASLMDEREARTDAAQFEDQDLPDTIDELDDFFARASTESNTSDDEFDDAFNEYMSHEYADLTKDKLIQLLLQRDGELDQLKGQLHQLQRKSEDDDQNTTATGSISST
eukprot:TRINITY_DN12677_c5_g1_i4.p1 TRINITY_DN12677_c5_g1~~TRINITY_DN12677_c5_g1_i4.p1  ORF type:complete len:211 (+),score=33.54 TRINITY_DN12677_c5_g1_i4:304-936(+)